MNRRNNTLLVPDQYQKRFQLLIVGSGGHAGVVVEAVGKPELIFGLIDELEELGKKKHGRTVIQEPNDLEKFKVHVAIGDNLIREQFGKSDKFSSRLVSIIHPLGVAMRSEIGKGSFIAAGAIVGSGCTIWDGVIVNTNATVDHDCVIGEYASIGPGASIGGRATISRLAMIGLGACVRDGVTIGEGVVIGMGSVVTKDIPDNSVAWGNPCRVRRQCV